MIKKSIFSSIVILMMVGLVLCFLPQSVKAQQSHIDKAVRFALQAGNVSYVEAIAQNFNTIPESKAWIEVYKGAFEKAIELAPKNAEIKFASELQKVRIENGKIVGMDLLAKLNVAEGSYEESVSQNLEIMDHNLSIKPDLEEEYKVEIIQYKKKCRYKKWYVLSKPTFAKTKANEQLILEGQKLQEEGRCLESLDVFIFLMKNGEQDNPYVLTKIELILGDADVDISLCNALLYRALENTPKNDST